jgi:valyl-tRNA synthetase
MIFSGVEHTKKAPFHTVFIHGMVRDDKGRKMSKSLGNGVDPIEIIETYGADALRFNIVTGNSPGNDIRFYPERCEAMRNFANKIWNASRFVMMNLTIDKIELPDSLEMEDKWILSKFNTLAGEVCENIDKYELGVAASKIYDFIWDSYCDWYIELAKPRLQCGGDDALCTQKVLLYVLAETLTLLHPFMPFITEEIWQALSANRVGDSRNAECRMENGEFGGDETRRSCADGGCGDVLMVRRYPRFLEALSFPREAADFESVMSAVRAVRARRADMGVPPSKRPNLTVVTDKRGVFESGRSYIGRLAYAGEVTITRDAPPDLSGLVSAATSDALLYMPLSQLVDIAKERERLDKEIAKANGDIERTEQKLSNENFCSKAPDQVVAAEREKLEKLRALLDNLSDSRRNLETGG